MGPRLGLAFVVMTALAMVPISEAFAERASTQQTRLKAKSKQATAPRRLRTLPPASALSLSGTYALTSVSGRPVRDIELAKSKVTFLGRGEVSVATACHGFGAKLESKSSPNQILGFSRVLAPSIGCPIDQNQANATTMGLFRETANIARAGNFITFFNTNGVNIAQWAAVTVNSPLPEVSAPQPGAPAPVRADFGDYVLTELNGNPVATYGARLALAPPRVPPVPEAAPTALPANTRLASSVPTLFLRANGNAMGSSGCNQYNATLVENADRTRRFGPVVSTKKACLDRGTRALESALFHALRTASRVDVGPRQIDLFAGNGARTARFSSTSARAQAGPSLYGTNWTLRSLNGVAVPRASPPTIKFEGHQASGSTSCNQYNIQHSRQNGRSRFTNGIGTEMSCGRDGRNDLERRYMAALATITTIEVSSTTLTLSSPDSSTILIFDAE